MSEYIERETALKAVGALQQVALLTQQDYYNAGVRAAKEALKALPASDLVEVVHGRWEVYLGGKEIMCSACKATFFTEDGETSKYCPNCGARMDLDT